MFLVTLLSAIVIGTEIGFAVLFVTATVLLTALLRWKLRYSKKLSLSATLLASTFMGSIVFIFAELPYIADGQTPSLAILLIQSLVGGFMLAVFATFFSILLVIAFDDLFILADGPTNG